MKPLRVLLASAAYRPHTSGVAEHVFHLGRKLRERGHEPHILTLSYSEPETATPGVTRIARAAIVPANRSRITLSLAPGLRSRVRQFMRGHEFDVVHCHGFFPPDLSYWVLETIARPAAVTFHTLGVRIPGLCRTACRAALARGWRNIGAPIAVSEAGRRWTEAWIDRKCRVVPNGVDLAEFRPGASRPDWYPREGPVVLYVGRLDRRKGLPVLIRAMPRVIRRFPGTRLVVIGSGPLEWSCRGLGARLGIAEHVTYAGSVSSYELPGCYSAASVFVSPALGGEAMGIVLIEALASGTPVIASRIAGYDEVIRESMDGLLFAPGDHQALAEAICLVLREPSLAARLRGQGLERAGEFSWEVVVDRLLPVYEEVTR